MFPMQQLMSNKVVTSIKTCKLLILFPVLSRGFKMEMLPSEILATVFSYLDGTSLKNSALVCKM